MSFLIGNGCLGNAGYSSGETIRSTAVANAALARQVAAGVIAIDNANRLVDNYKDQRDISQRTIDISREAQDQLRTVFWPREEQFLAEFSTPEAIETVEAMGARYAGRLVSSVASAFARQLAEARCSKRRHCTSSGKKTVQDLMLARGTAMANARVLGRNIAFAEYQARTDINLSRRMQAVALGRGLIDQAMTLYQAAGRGLAAAGEVLSTQLGSALETFGYYNQVRSDARTRASMAAMPAADFSATMPMPASSGWNGQPLPGQLPMTTDFGLRTSVQGTYDPTVGSIMSGDNTGLSKTSEPNVFKELQAEKMNDARVGNNDLARTGIRSFPVIGAPGTVLINMDLFPLKYVDHKTEGDAG